MKRAYKLSGGLAIMLSLFHCSSEPKKVNVAGNQTPQSNGGGNVAQSVSQNAGAVADPSALQVMIGGQADQATQTLIGVSGQPYGWSFTINGATDSSQVGIHVYGLPSGASATGDLTYQVNVNGTAVYSANGAKDGILTIVARDYAKCLAAGGTAASACHDFPATAPATGQAYENRMQVRWVIVQSQQDIMNQQMQQQQATQKQAATTNCITSVLGGVIGMFVGVGGGGIGGAILPCAGAILSK